MMKILTKFLKPLPTTNRRFIYFIYAGFLGSLAIFIISNFTFLIPTIFPFLDDNYRQRPECTCLRPRLPPLSSPLPLEQNGSRAYLCSEYATRRGPHQRIISISLFGPKENKMFQFNRSLTFLDALLVDLNKVYSDGFTLRIHHDDTINVTDIICPIECKNPNVDFCDMMRKLYIPPKIWRFIPAGDPLVDISKLRIFDNLFLSVTFLYA
jgi:hypothetical protein